MQTLQDICNSERLLARLQPQYKVLLVTLRFGSDCSTSQHTHSSDKKQCVTVYKPITTIKDGEAEKQAPNVSLAAAGMDAAVTSVF